jgi:hypothetical protein
MKKDRVSSATLLAINGAAKKQRTEEQGLYQALPKPLKGRKSIGGISHVPGPQQQRIKAKYINGSSIRQIAREEKRARETITRIVRSKDMQQMVLEQRDRFFGAMDEVLEALLRSIQHGKDGGWLAYRCLRDAGIIPSRESKRCIYCGR